MGGKGLVPELRFGEFGGDWTLDKLGAITKFSKGRGISKADIEDEGITPCIRYGELYTTYDTVINEIASYTNVSEQNLVFSRGGEVLVPASGEDSLDIATSSVVLNKGVALGGDLNILNSELDGVFLSYSLSYKNRFQIARVAQGNSVVHVYASQLSCLDVCFPEEKEQQKIAAFLTAIDEKLNQLRRKRDALQSYKRGVMQKIFSQEIRFAQDDGAAFPDWKEKELSEVLEPVIREVEKPTHNYLAIGVRSHMKGTFQKPGFDPDTIAMDKLFLVKNSDLVVNITFAWEGAIAIVKPEDDGGLVSHRFPTYLFKEDLLRDYFRYVLSERRFKYTLDLISPGGAGRNRVLSKKDFLKIKWALPEVGEQQKIATFLSVIDKKIDAVNQKITQTESFKKGLLQKMFV